MGRGEDRSEFSANEFFQAEAGVLEEPTVPEKYENQNLELDSSAEKAAAADAKRAAFQEILKLDEKIAATEDPEAKAQLQAVRSYMMKLVVDSK